MIDNFIFQIKLICFSAERLARTFCKNMIDHACEKCPVRGITFENIRVYPGIEYSFRSDDSFRDLENLYHHLDFFLYVK